MMNTENLPLETIIKLEEETRVAFNKLRERRERMEAEERDRRLDHLKPLAIRAHDLLCQWSHCDGCSWGYEVNNGVHNWTGWEHDRWLKHIEHLILGTREKQPFPITVEQYTAILDHIEALKKINPHALYFIRSGIAAR